MSTSHLMLLSPWHAMILALLGLLVIGRPWTR